MQLFSYFNIIVFLFAILLILIVDRLFEYFYPKTDKILISFTKSFIKIIIGLITLYIIFDQYESFDKFISIALTNSAFLVAVIGFILQSAIKNIVAGTLLVSSKAYQVGDRIKIEKENIVGVVEEMSSRHTIIRLVSNERAVVPNAIMNDSVVINNNMLDDVTSYPIEITLKTSSDINLALAIIKEIVFSHEDVLDRTPLPNIGEITPEYTTLKMLIFTKDIKTSFDTVFDLKLEILREFKENNLL